MPSEKSMLRLWGIVYIADKKGQSGRAGPFPSCGHCLEGRAMTMTSPGTKLAPWYSGK